MTNFSIVRVGKEYVVQADEKSILKVSSRRHAVKLVSVAAELLDAPPAPPLVPEAPAELSTACDLVTKADLEAMADRGIGPDSSEVS